MGGGIRPEEVSDTKKRNNDVLPPFPLPPRRCSAPEPTRNDTISPSPHHQAPSSSFHRETSKKGTPVVEIPSFSPLRSSPDSSYPP